MKHPGHSFLRIPRHPDIAAFSLSEKVIYWTAILTPLWWLLGVQPIFYPSVAAFLFLINFRIDTLLKGLPLCVWAWFTMAVVMLWTAILGLYDMGAGLTTVAAAIVTFFKGYFMIFSCMALPFFCKVRIQVITRAVALMSIGFLVNIILQMMMLAVGISGNKYPPLEPLLARAIPGDASGSLMIILPTISSFFGIPLPRTVLHTADPPILGCCALLCILISLTESNEKLKNLALLSSFCALIISFSRSSWLGFMCTIFILICFRYRAAIQLPIWFSSAAFFTCSFLGIAIHRLLEKPQEFFDSARAESSKERAIVVQSTIEAWLEKPWLGWGVIRGKAWLYDDAFVTLGSFSTYAAVLYLNGIVGFIVFIFALATTLNDFFRVALFQKNFACQIAFSGYLILVALIYATPLSWMAIYLWFFFMWSATALRDAICTKKSELKISWSHLA